MSSDDANQKIHAAMQAGRPVTIIYHGGSNPGAKRTITPIAVFVDRVRARCHASNAVKPFMFEKIEIVEAGSQGELAHNWTDPAKPEMFSAFADVRDLHREYAPLLESKGWFVGLEEYEFGWAISLFARFKNGNLRKSPSEQLRYEHTSYDSVAMEDGSLTPCNLRPSVLPWRYKSKSYKKNLVPITDFLKAAGISDEELGASFHNNSKT